MRVLVRAVAVGAALVPANVQARDFLYPWKPGATLQQVSDDQGGCLTAAKAIEKGSMPTSGSASAAGPRHPPPVGSKS